MKCAACGSANLVEGSLLDAGNQDVKFKPGDTPLLKWIFGVGLRQVRAYGCVHCGHLQLAVKFKEDDLRRHQEFEGQQPDVLERLNSESPADD